MRLNVIIYLFFETDVFFLEWLVKVYSRIMKYKKVLDVSEGFSFRRF